MPSLGMPFIELNQVESTNNYAMAQLQAYMAAHGATWFAWQQTAGKGQRQKAWKAAPGLNITMSTAIEPQGLPITRQFMLSAAVALACHDFFSIYVTSDVSIKWPNDLYWKDRKAGGILIENLVQGQLWRFAIVGIGLNINQHAFDDDLPNPVSLKQITGLHFDVVLLGKLLCKLMEKRWQQLLHDDGPLLQEYIQKMYRIHQQVSLKYENATLQGRLLGVNEQGELLLDAGKTIALPHGGVEWLPQNPSGELNTL